ncbi:trehalose-6-phosphatase [Syntrophotalea carbinolica DSM 2380]|uniref:Trehalose 6-phosphate phosphatase n=2 Tax=Syntrophotalea carbinolica TaxID=19 RepID=Q3A8H5_SYNC1|nr:trehalose-6-phosphatase [Syntrophotalea carbinolica DSM 2380]
MEFSPHKTMSHTLPSALECLATIQHMLQNKRGMVFLDYDGTLTPIVERPEWAQLSQKMRDAVNQLSQRCDVAIVSGRDLQDIRNLVGIEGILYAGSHGFDISGPGGHLELEQGIDYLPALDRAETALTKQLAEVAGTQIERKRFAIAVHFRRADPADVSQIETIVDTILEKNPGLRKTGGKMIFELRPDIDWDKGKALRWILARLGMHDDEVLPIYIGDDLTDEDAFCELQKRGIAILVSDEQRLTAANYVLNDPLEVEQFLKRLKVNQNS